MAIATLPTHHHATSATVTTLNHQIPLVAKITIHGNLVAFSAKYSHITYHDNKQHHSSQEALSESELSLLPTSSSIYFSSLLFPSSVVTNNK